MLKRIISFLFLGIFLYSCCEAQLISSEIYETEEDLQEGLELGLLTFDQYLELLDLIQAKIIPTSEEVERLFFVPDVSPGDISQIKDKGSEDILLNQKMDSFIGESKKREPGLS